MKAITPDRYIFKMMAKLIENNIYFDFQHQTRSKFYNFCVHDKFGKTLYYHGEDLKSIEEKLEWLYGDLLGKCEVPLPSAAPIFKMPPPPGLR